MSDARKAKDKSMAADLKKRGIFHGKRLTKPAPNSGGQTMVNKPGSAKYQRLVESLRGKR